MNKRASVFLSVLVASMLFVTGMVFLNYIKTEVSVTTSTAGLSCDSVSSLSDGEKVTCLLVDGTVPLFVISVLSVVGGIILGKTN